MGRRQFKLSGMACVRSLRGTCGRKWGGASRRGYLRTDLRSQLPFARHAPGLLALRRRGPESASFFERQNMPLPIGAEP